MNVDPTLPHPFHVGGREGDDCEVCWGSDTDPIHGPEQTPEGWRAAAIERVADALYMEGIEGFASGSREFIPIERVAEVVVDALGINP